MQLIFFQLQEFLSFEIIYYFLIYEFTTKFHSPLIAIFNIKYRFSFCKLSLKSAQFSLGI